jgi:predicted dehydrogenase
VLVEKPLARSLADAQLMLDAAQQYGVKLMCGQVVRYFREYATAHQLITRGDIGTVGVARTSRCGAYPAAHTWYADTVRSGGVALDLLVHDLDWLRWTFGEVTRVYARGLIDRAIPDRDTVMVILRFESGVIGYAEANWSYPNGFHTSLEVAGSNGLVAHRNDDVVDITLRPQAGSGARLAHDPLALEDPYLAQLIDFTQWCTDGTAPRSTARDGYEAVRLSLAVLESVQTGRPVHLQGAAS